MQITKIPLKMVKKRLFQTKIIMKNKVKTTRPINKYDPQMRPCIIQGEFHHLGNKMGLVHYIPARQSYILIGLKFEMPELLYQVYKSIRPIANQNGTLPGCSVYFDWLKVWKAVTCFTVMKINFQKSFASSSFFLSTIKITRLNSQQPKTRGHVEHLS